MAAIPYKQASVSDADLLSRMLGAFLIIALIALAAAWALRHRWPAALGAAKGQKAVLRVLQRTRVSATNSLVVVVYRGEELLLAEGPQGLQLLERQSVEHS
ncbi:flagellar biosynthetic protein FliO [Andreprevotia lacus]|nr:flagellar biosynthetic protein FliO [Andreprevotia lacus]